MIKLDQRALKKIYKTCNYPLKQLPEQIVPSQNISKHSENIVDDKDFIKKIKRNKHDFERVHQLIIDYLKLKNPTNIDIPSRIEYMRKNYMITQDQYYALQQIIKPIKTEADMENYLMIEMIQRVSI
ncbi:hypothetical protein pb186bvf_000418 [Paramecium bursaria]